MLNSDPKRQAIHSLRGYAYQIWQSLDEWLNLSEDEVLYLEGAEDIDKLASDNAETIQVKDIQSGSVTLNSKEILDSIKNFWKNKKHNPTVRIRYRFLTTAERGKEKPSVFEKMKGLDLWDNCKYKDCDPKPIKNFLLSKDNIPDELKTFINSVDKETFRAEIIVPLEWDTGNPDREYLEKIIIEKIKKIGIRFGILPAASEKALPALLKYVFEKACSIDDRKLDSLNLVEQFQANTTVNVPYNSMMNIFSALTAQLEGIMPFPSSSAISPLYIVQQNIAPILPYKYTRRQKLVNLLKEKIQENKFITLHGSTGMGKSTIAALIVDSFKLENKWINLRGQDANSINAALFNIAVSIKNFEDTILIIDDISFGIDTNIYENGVVVLINLVLSKNGYVIITTQDDLPDKLSHYLHHINDLIVDIPTMDQDEIKELAQYYGCHGNRELDLWSVFIFVKTGGHPQLVHAKIRNLESSGWPVPTIENLAKPDDFETIKNEVKKRLMSDLPIDSARTLSYRLSILPHPFKLEHSLIMGEKTPAIDKPGEVFALLVGPWIERLSSGYYRISPLLKDLANDIWPPTEIKDLHAQAVKAFLSEKNLSSIEISNAFFHAIKGECGEFLIPLLLSLLQNGKNFLPKISEDLGFLTLLAAIPGQKIYPQNPVVSFLMRFIQFSIAAEIDKKDTALKIDKAWEQEINDLKADEYKTNARLFFLVKTILMIDVPFSLSVIMSRIKELFQKNNLVAWESIKSIALLAIQRCKSHKDLLEFVTTLEWENEDIRNLYLSFLNTKNDWTGYLISVIYLKECNSASPEWRGYSA